MGKTKIRCNTCGKWFQSANAKDITCPECAQKARKEKLAAKSALPAPAKAAVTQQPPPKPKPKPVQSGTNQWLDTLSDVKVAKPDQPTRPKIPFSPAPRDTRGGPDASRNAGSPGNNREDQGPTNYREREGANRGPGNYRENTYRPPSGPYHVGGGSGLPDAGPRPRQPMEGGLNRGPHIVRPDKPPRPAGQGGKPKVKVPKPPPAPKPKREKIEPPKPFEPTAEQITQVETRYLELATPIEFDGIRTQIAQELGIPKTAVKKIIKDLRDRQHIPSWWDAQSYKGDDEELARIKTAYEPYLPLPDVGIHKKIAEELSLKAGDVYQAIKLIRTQMGLPQYNDPALHGIELKSAKSTEDNSEAVPAIPPTNTLSAPVPTNTLNGTDAGKGVAAIQEETQPEEVSAKQKVEPAEDETSITTEA